MYFLCVYTCSLLPFHTPLKNPKRGLPTNKKKSKLWYKITNILDLDNYIDGEILGKTGKSCVS